VTIVCGLMGFRSIDPSEIPGLHPVAQIRDGWPRLSGGSGIAAWSRFDPLDFPEVLPWVLLLRQEDPADPRRLRYTICGDGCRQTFGFSYQGKLFGEDLPAEAVAQWLREFSAIRHGQGPLYSFTPLPVSDREFIDIYRGVFGFSEDGRRVDRFLVVLAPDNVRVTSRRAPVAEPSAPSRTGVRNAPRASGRPPRRG
jgi:hypothetical protein